MRTIKREIVGAIIFSNDRHVLIGKNSKGGAHEDLWVIPGGGIDEGETKEEAVRREILEEVTIDINIGKIRLLPEVQTGTTQKTLRETGERVLVDMTIYNFQVDIDLPADEIHTTPADDFGYAEWISFDHLLGKSYSPSVEELLRSFNLI